MTARPLEYQQKQPIDSIEQLVKYKCGEAAKVADCNGYWWVYEPFGIDAFADELNEAIEEFLELKGR